MHLERNSTILQFIHSSPIIIAMKTVIQRVKQAKVTVDQEVTGAISQGLLVFLGVHIDDRPEDTTWLVNKILDFRIFQDEQGKMNKSLRDINGEILVVSQFTLYGNCMNGRRPDFIQSAPPEIAIPIYEKFVGEVRDEIGDVQTGKFGANMDVSLINDGPVTFILESKK